MRNITILLLLLVSTLQAQPVLTALDFEASVYYKIHNGGYSTTVGGDMIFSSIASSSYGSYRSVPLSMVPNASNFPTATSAVQYTYEGGGWSEYTLYETSDLYHKKIGFINGNFLNYSTTLITQLPLHYHEYTNEVGGFYYDSFGSVTTPYGTYSDVILLKRTYGSLQSLFNYEYRWIATNPYRIIAIDYLYEGSHSTSVYEFLDYALSNEQYQTNSFSVYPNPTTGDFTIGNQTIMQGSATIYDVLGKKITENKNLAVSNSISLKDFASGLYFLKIANEQNQILYTQKIIKQ